MTKASTVMDIIQKKRVLDKERRLASKVVFGQSYIEPKKTSSTKASNVSVKKPVQKKVQNVDTQTDKEFTKTKDQDVQTQPTSTP